MEWDNGISGEGANNSEWNHTCSNGAGVQDGPGACRNCGQEGHLARDCLEPKKLTGECYNCGEVGHNKADCTRPRVERPFTGICRTCGEEGHQASLCPQKKPMLCRNCGEEGHKTSDCTNARLLDNAKVADMPAEDAWQKMQKADKERDLDEFREAFNSYVKATPTATFVELETTFRSENWNIHIIAMEREIADVMTVVNLQGKLDCNYVATFAWSSKPSRARQTRGWPSSPADNLARLGDAGFVQDRKIPKCVRCGELGHISKSCNQEQSERERVQVYCFNCGGKEHRVRDCPVARTNPFACRNCGKCGHQQADCTEPRSTENVECNNCGNMGHFARDCPEKREYTMVCRNCGEEGHMAKECEKLKNPDMVTCRNCEKTGHFSKDCPEPKDWSKVKCSNCGEMGHGRGRCQANPASGALDGGWDDPHGANGANANDGGDGTSVTPAWRDGSAGGSQVEQSGDW